jgi:hypothetical protein
MSDQFTITYQDSTSGAFTASVELVNKVMRQTENWTLGQMRDYISETVGFSEDDWTKPYYRTPNDHGNCGYVDMAYGSVLR